MTRQQRVRYEMFVKVREFGRTHRDAFPESSHAGKAFAAIDAAAEEIAAHGAAMLLKKETREQTKAAVREEILERLHGIARTARIAAATAPVAGELVRLQVPKSDAALVMTVQGIVREGPAAIAPLVPLGVSETVVADLAALLERFERADRGSRASRAARLEARSRLAGALDAAAEPLRVLDVIVANTFQHDEAVLDAWKRARHVPGRVKGTARPARPAVTPATEVPPAPEPDAATGPSENTESLRKAS